jgi:hypothetical protein
VSRAQLQFRKIEQLLGLQDTQRASYGQRQYCSYLSEPHRLLLQAHAAAAPSLHDLLAKWLERTPFVDANATPGPTLPATSREPAQVPPPVAAANGGGPAPPPGLGLGPGLAWDAAPPEVSSLWAHYRGGVERMLAADRAFVLQQAASQSAQASQVAASGGSFDSSFEGAAAAGVDAAADRRAAAAAKQLDEIDARGEALSTILDAGKVRTARFLCWRVRAMRTAAVFARSFSLLASRSLARSLSLLSLVFLKPVCVRFKLAVRFLSPSTKRRGRGATFGSATKPCKPRCSSRSTKTSPS